MLRLAVSDPDPAVALRAVSALSSVVRNFPEAQVRIHHQNPTCLHDKLAFDNQRKIFDSFSVACTAGLSIFSHSTSTFVNEFI